MPLETFISIAPIEILERIINYAGIENLVSLLVPNCKLILDQNPTLRTAVNNVILQNSGHLSYNNRITKPMLLTHYLHPEAFDEIDFCGGFRMGPERYHWEYLDDYEARKRYRFLSTIEDFLTVQAYCQDNELDMVLLISFRLWSYVAVNSFCDLVKLLSDKSSVRYNVELECSIFPGIVFREDYPEYKSYDGAASEDNSETEGVDSETEEYPENQAISENKDLVSFNEQDYSDDDNEQRYYDFIPNLSKLITPLMNQCPNAITGLALLNICQEVKFNLNGFPALKWAIFKYGLVQLTSSTNSQDPDSDSNNCSSNNSMLEILELVLEFNRLMRLDADVLVSLNENLNMNLTQMNVPAVDTRSPVMDTRGGTTPVVHAWNNLVVVFHFEKESRVASFGKFRTSSNSMTLTLGAKYDDGDNEDDYISEMEVMPQVTSFEFCVFKSGAVMPDLSKFPNLVELRACWMSNLTVFENWRVPDSLTGLHVQFDADLKDADFGPLISRLPLGLKKLTIYVKYGFRLTKEQLNFTKFVKLNYLAISGLVNDNLNQLTLPNSITKLIFTDCDHLDSIAEIQFPYYLQFLKIESTSLKSITKPKFPSSLKSLHLCGNRLQKLDLSTNDKNEGFENMEVLDLKCNWELKEENLKLSSKLKFYVPPWKRS
ncbi:hypothetical protein I9W82_004011 [Candida metapsilosis]|uniref:Uncharacterized protein n=1 Tax=Candida metapsilosis TaxID=273372 RepID=A0A8H7ZAW8_9ASCO|nr:hypothetical protein I9W82_004011 [Candida metapsilosis]